MGGRSAEKLIFKDTTTGAGNDIAVATDISRKMVTEWGMTENIGPLSFAQQSEEVFLGRDISMSNDLSEEVSNLIDSEVTKLVKTAENNADRILEENIDQLHSIAKALLEFESIDGKDLAKLVNGEKIIKIKDEGSSVTKNLEGEKHKKTLIMIKNLLNDFKIRSNVKIMGILNLSNDSFVDKKSLEENLNSVIDADIIDVGAQSSKPGSDEISVIEEKRLDLL